MEEDNTTEESVAKTMPKATTLSSQTYALYEALQTALVCVKREAGRRFSHETFWEGVRSKGVCLDVREELLDKRERRRREKESEYHAAIGKMARLDLREARLLLRESDLQDKENALRERVDQVEQIDQLESKIRIYETGNSEEEIKALKRRVVTDPTTVDNQTRLIESLQSEIKDLKQARIDPAGRVEGWIRQIGKLRSEHRSCRNAKIHQMIEEAERTKSVYLRLTKELSLKFGQLRSKMKTLERTAEQRMHEAVATRWYDQELSRWTKIIRRNREGDRSTCSRAWSAHLRKSMESPGITPAWRELLHLIDQLLVNLEGAKKRKRDQFGSLVGS